MIFYFEFSIVSILRKRVLFFECDRLSCTETRTGTQMGTGTGTEDSNFVKFKGAFECWGVFNI